MGPDLPALTSSGPPGPRPDWLAGNVHHWLRWVPPATPGQALPCISTVRDSFPRREPEPACQQEGPGHGRQRTRALPDSLPPVGGGAPSSLPVAERRSSEVLGLGRLVIHGVHRSDRTDDGLQEGRGRSAAGVGPGATSDQPPQTRTDSPKSLDVFEWRQECGVSGTRERVRVTSSREWKAGPKPTGMF